MQGLTGLTDLYGQTADGLYGAGALESQGTTADPAHGTWGDEAGPPWQTPPYPSGGQTAYDPQWVLVAEQPDVAPAENTPHDRTPTSTAAPYPRLEYPGGEIRNAGEQWRAQEASRVLHGEDLGGNWFNEQPGGRETPTHWQNTYDVSEGSTVLAGVPDQIKGAGTGKDIAQGFGTADRFGYSAGHFLRRIQVDPVPGNYPWPVASERPFIVPAPAVQTTFNGPDSPYGVYGDTTQDMGQSVAGAAVETLPTPYAAPPDPSVAPSTTQPGEAPSIGAGWF